MEEEEEEEEPCPDVNLSLTYLYVCKECDVLETKTVLTHLLPFTFYTSYCNLVI